MKEKILKRIGELEQLIVKYEHDPKCGASIWLTKDELKFLYSLLECDNIPFPSSN